MPSIAADFQVGPPESGARLDHFLAVNVPGLSRSRLQDLIKQGHVKLNGLTVKPGVRLRAGDSIVLREPPPIPANAQAEDIALRVLFEDEDLIVIDKPPGLVVHPAAGHQTGTLVNALLHHCQTLSGIGGEQRPGIIHRLDKETSGCLVAAKSDSAHQALARQFASREVTKIYLALAAGRFARRAGVIEAPIGRHPVQRKKMAIVARGRTARTDYRVLADIEEGALVECTLHTGRTHQIRVHLKHLGHPVLGDEVYGRRGCYPRQMLHAWKLGFAHPRTGEPLSFESPLPQDFKDAGAPWPLPLKDEG
jgi:23S rRNA pseudouridine1911/1915/1917 synthase